MYEEFDVPAESMEEEEMVEEDPKEVEEAIKHYIG